METERIQQIAEIVEAIDKKKDEEKRGKEIEIKEFKNMSFEEWYFYQANKEDGLISQVTASKILGVSSARIVQLKKQGRLKEIKHPKDNGKYISLRETKKILSFLKFKREYQYGRI